VTVTGTIPICVACTRRRSFDEEHPTVWCEAFPGGIPEEIFTGGFDHRKKFAGDHGVRFALDPALTHRLKLYEQQAV
jgi:hypothetical protein